MTRIMANGLYYCNSMNQNAYLYILRQFELFGTFLNWTYSFLQNILAKILSINNIYKSLQVAYAKNIRPYIWFDFGRLIRVLLIFPPIEMEDPEQDWYYNAQTAYYNAD
jgi:hypothetical protein